MRSVGYQRSPHLFLIDAFYHRPDFYRCHGWKPDELSGDPIRKATVRVIYHTLWSDDPKILLSNLVSVPWVGEGSVSPRLMIRTTGRITSALTDLRAHNRTQQSPHSQNGWIQRRANTLIDIVLPLWTTWESKTVRVIAPSPTQADLWLTYS